MSNFQNSRNSNKDNKIIALECTPYPDNFYIGKAISNGSCFFDSFRQGLRYQKGIEVTIEKLRRNCKEFAQNSPPEWFIKAIANNCDSDGKCYSETLDAYIANIMYDNKWGNPDIEGRILCREYNVMLHVIEKYNVEGQEIWTNQIVNELESESVNDVKYDEINIIHMINKGNAHFEPLFNKTKNFEEQLCEGIKLKQEQKDFLLARRFQIDEIVKYCNNSMNFFKRKEVEERFDELSKNNFKKGISDVVNQCIYNVKYCVQYYEKKSVFGLLYDIKEVKIEKLFNRQYESKP
ncbi:MAG: hypothetical protein LJI21_01830 [Wolbachia endosymbiont of Menacanthus eurysternus]|nr:MAG: hypothetical protein LJI21_01830 [Wolbachia endosymbiont of Menacanthus eurysternus]